MTILKLFYRISSSNFRVFRCEAWIGVFGVDRLDWLAHRDVSVSVVDWVLCVEALSSVNWKWNPCHFVLLSLHLSQPQDLILVEVNLGFERWHLDLLNDTIMYSASDNRLGRGLWLGWELSMGFGMHLDWSRPWISKGIEDVRLLSLELVLNGHLSHSSWSFGLAKFKENDGNSCNSNN